MTMAGILCDTVSRFTDFSDGARVANLYCGIGSKAESQLTTNQYTDILKLKKYKTR